MAASSPVSSPPLRMPERWIGRQTPQAVFPAPESPWAQPPQHKVLADGQGVWKAALMLCADTSFPFFLYGHDTHSDKAFALPAKAAEPLLLSAPNNYELSNALRFAECLQAIALKQGFSTP